MTDRYEKIRAALAMGPTPGPWLFCPTNSGTFVKSEMLAGYFVEVRHCRTAQDVNADAHLIAACDPDTIRALLDERDALAAEVERLEKMLRELERELRRETERRWEGNRRATQEYIEDMRTVLKEAAQICRDLDDEALAKENRLACGAECAGAIADLAVRWNVPFGGEQ